MDKASAKFPVITSEDMSTKLPIDLTNVLEIQRVIPELTSDDISRLAEVASASRDSQSVMNRCLQGLIGE